MTLRAFGHSGKAHGDTEPGPYSDIEYHDTSPSGKNQMDCVIVDGRIRWYPTKRFMRWLTNVEREFRDSAKGMQPYLPIQGSVMRLWSMCWRSYHTGSPGMQDAVWHMCERFGIVTNDKWFQHPI